MVDLVAYGEFESYQRAASLNTYLSIEPRYNPGRIREAPRGEYWTHGLDAIKHYGQYIDAIQRIPAYPNHSYSIWRYTMKTFDAEIELSLDRPGKHGADPSMHPPQDGSIPNTFTYIHTYIHTKQISTSEVR